MKLYHKWMIHWLKYLSFFERLLQQFLVTHNGLIDDFHCIGLCCFSLDFWLLFDQIDLSISSLAEKLEDLISLFLLLIISRNMSSSSRGSHECWTHSFVFDITGKTLLFTKFKEFSACFKDLLFDFLATSLLNFQKLSAWWTRVLCDSSTWCTQVMIALISLTWLTQARETIAYFVLLVFFISDEVAFQRSWVLSAFWDVFFCCIVINVRVLITTIYIITLIYQVRRARAPEVYSLLGHLPASFTFITAIEWLDLACVLMFFKLICIKYTHSFDWWCLLFSYHVSLNDVWKVIVSASWCSS
jgi:hypothetical protein